MSLLAYPEIRARKTPVQARSADTIEVLLEGTVQVLLSDGADRLTTTRVAARAGVSVGTLYQYYPNKQALLYALLDRKLNLVSEAVEQACAQCHGQPLAPMVEKLMQAFVDAKMAHADVSAALYKISAELDSAAVILKSGKRSRTAIASMLRTAPELAHVPDALLRVKAETLCAAMSGAIRSVLEGGASPGAVRALRKELVLLGRGYLSVPCS